MNSNVKGYIFGSVAAATYGTIPMFTLPLYGDGMTADSILFFRYIIAAPVIALMTVMRGRGFHIPRHSRLWLILMGVLMAGSSITLFESYHYMSAGIASTMLFVYPLMVAVLMALFFRERLKASTLCCIAMAMGGIVLLFKGDPNGDTLSVAGTVLVMISALTYALYIIGIDRRGLKETPTLTIIFYVLCVGALFFGAKILIVPGETFTVPQHWYYWGCILALAVVPTVISFLCTTASIHSIGPTPTAILGVLEPLTAVIIGVTVFGEEMTGRDWAGMALIAVSVSLVVAGGKITGPLLRFRKLFKRR